MLSVAYVSSASSEMTEPELVELMSAARRRNERLGVSGMLLYCGGNFMQVLEGPEDAVRRLYTDIGTDSRHRGIITLIDEPIGERRFAGWSMGFRRVTARELEQVAGWSDFMEIAPAGHAADETGVAVYDLLNTFRETMR